MTYFSSICPFKGVVKVFYSKMTYFSSICQFKGVVKVFLLQDDLLFPHLPVQSCNHRLLYSKMNNFSRICHSKVAITGCCIRRWTYFFPIRQSKGVVKVVLLQDDLLFPHLPFQSCNHRLLYSKMNLFFPHLPVQRGCKGGFTRRWPIFPASARSKVL